MNTNIYIFISTLRLNLQKIVINKDDKIKNYHFIA